MSNRNAAQLDVQTLTEQEVFDRVCNHLAQQKRPSVRGTSCAYRSGDLKCAAGVFIPDKLYSPDLEGLVVMARRLDMVFIGISYETRYELLQSLQDAHDNSIYKTKDALKQRLKDVARQYNLNPTAVNKITKWYPIKKPV